MKSGQGRHPVLLDTTERDVRRSGDATTERLAC